MSKVYDIIDSGFNPDLLERMFNFFLNEIEWQQDTYYFHGKKITPLRKTFMFGKSYSYSGIKKEAIPFNKQMLFIKNNIERVLKLEKGYFNGCLLNLYENGNAYIAYHKDNEPEMDPNAIIVSFSLGAKRKFYIKNDQTKEVAKLIHKPGQILIMYPECQKSYQHSVPKELKVKEPRISLTFRKFL